MAGKKIEGQILIAPNGEIAVRTTNGNFEEGSGVIAAIAAIMKARGVTFDQEFKPEQHIHGDDGRHVHEQHTVKA